MDDRQAQPTIPNHRLRFLPALLLLLGTLPLGAEIRLDIDFAAARDMVSVAGRKVSDEELERIAALEGVQAVIRQGARFQPDSYTKENFLAGLREFAAGRDPQPDPFDFKRFRERLPETRKLLTRIEADPKALAGNIKSRISAYAPDVDLDIKLILVASGSSDGFTHGGGKLYVAIDYFRDDWDGLALLGAHELYHAVQNALLEKSGVTARIGAMTGRESQTIRLLLATLKEGTGTLVGDALAVSKPGVYTAWFAEKYRRNLQRIPQNFALFETMLFRLAKDEVQYSTLYPLGFSGSWDSPLYFVGYRMAKVIEKYEGRKAIRGAWSVSPAAFFERYAALAIEHADDPDVVPLTAATRALITEAAKAYSAPP